MVGEESREVWETRPQHSAQKSMTEALPERMGSTGTNAESSVSSEMSSLLDLDLLLALEKKVPERMGSTGINAESSVSTRMSSFLDLDLLPAFSKKVPQRWVQQE